MTCPFIICFVKYSENTRTQKYSLITDEETELVVYIYLSSSYEPPATLCANILLCIYFLDETRSGFQ